MEGLESVVAEQDALAHSKSDLKSKAQPSPLKEEFMYTPQKEVDPTSYRISNRQWLFILMTVIILKPFHFKH